MPAANQYSVGNPLRTAPTAAAKGKRPTAPTPTYTPTECAAILAAAAVRASLKASEARALADSAAAEAEEAVLKAERALSAATVKGK